MIVQQYYKLNLDYYNFYLRCQNKWSLIYLTKFSDCTTLVKILGLWYSNIQYKWFLNFVVIHYKQKIVLALRIFI